MPMSRVYVKICLLGKFAVIDRAGRPITPKNQKTQALIALLTLADRGERTRVWLRDKLWSEFDTEHANANLRQTLADIRRSFGDISSLLFKIDRLSVCINFAHVQVDVHLARKNSNALFEEAIANRDLLEGIDVADPEFEDWLTVERRRWCNFVDAAQMSAEAPKVHWSRDSQPERQTESSVSLSKRPSLAILPPEMHDDRSHAHTLANTVIDHIALQVHDFEAVMVTDHRMRPQYQLHSQGLASCRLHSTMYPMGNDFLLALAVVDSYEGRVVWQTKLPIASIHANRDNYLPLLEKTNLASDEILRLLMRKAEDVKSSQIHASRHVLLHGISGAFASSEAELRLAEHAILTSLELEESSQALAWLAFIGTMTHGQGHRLCSSYEHDELRSLIQRALDIEPLNPLTLALCGHVAGFVLKDQLFSSELLHKSLSINSYRPLAWDLFSMSLAYQGELEQAYKAAQWARAIGRFSPYRHYFESSCCITASLTQRHDEAIEFGTAAIAGNPEFSPVLHHMISSAGHLGDRTTSRQLIEKLQQIEPCFSFDEQKERSRRFNNNDSRKHFLAGLERAGIALA